MSSAGGELVPLAGSCRNFKVLSDDTIISPGDLHPSMAVLEVLCHQAASIVLYRRTSLRPASFRSVPESVARMTPITFEK